MKKAKFIKYLNEHNCYATGRQKGSHAQFRNTETMKSTIVPMHNEIDDMLCKKICKQLGIPVIGSN